MDALSARFAEIVKTSKLTYERVAELVDAESREVASVVLGDPAGRVSIHRLLLWFTMLGYDVEIKVH